MHSRGNGSTSEAAASALLAELGGPACLRRLSERFHSRVEASESLRPLFPKDMSALTERLALFLAEALGGPREYTTARGKTSLGCRHAHLAISRAHADEWLACMFAAMEDEGIRGEAADRLREYLTGTAYGLGDPLQPYYEIELAQLEGALQSNPSLSAIDHHGRTLLGDACLRWDVERVDLLLRFGADVRVGGGMDHDALYQVARGGAAGREGNGVVILERLMRHGADVNRRSGPGRGTPLHMAARRGHVSIARVLLDVGATVDLRDSKGVTPLMRAVNCGRLEVVRLLLDRGADPRIPDRAGTLPIDAAPTAALREALRQAMDSRAGDRRSD